MPARSAKKRTPARKKKSARKSKLGTVVNKAATTAKRTAKRVTKNPNQTVAQVSKKVHKTSSLARDVGEKVAAAGVLIKETADFVDAIATRSGTRKTRKK
jgi:uncharacterized protein YoxC